MSNPKGIEATFTAFRETGKPLRLPDGCKSLHSSSKDFMRIGLMTHIPNDPVFGRIQHVMQCNGEFYNPQSCTKMAASLTDTEQHILSYFIG